MITAKLKGGEKYILTFYSNGFLNWTEVKSILMAQRKEDNSDFWCPTVNIELAIVPSIISQKRIDVIDSKCPSAPSFPDLNLQQLQNENALKYA